MTLDEDTAVTEVARPAVSERSTAAASDGSVGERVIGAASREAVEDGRCPECETATVVHDADRGESVCEVCGLVVDDAPVDCGPEWRAFTRHDRETRSRVGAPLTASMHDRGLTTSIDWRNRDASGRALEADDGTINRLRIWQERIRTKNAGERNLQYALSEIDRMASALAVPDPVRETASVIYRRALDADLIKGRSIEGIATSALYAACRQEGIPRSLEEMTAVSRVDRREIGRAYRYVCTELDINLEPVRPNAFVPRFCSELDASAELERTARAVVEETATQGTHVGKSPTGYAAAAIYVAGLLCDESIPQREAAAVADTTVVTIRNHYREQLEAIEAEPAV